MTAEQYAIEVLVGLVGGSKPMTETEIQAWVLTNRAADISISNAEIKLVTLASLIVSEAR
jgi:hypothetical protein